MAEDQQTTEYRPQLFSAAERRITMTALMIVFMLSALDQTIVSTAMPRIVAQLKGLNLYAWVTTAYLLSSTVMVPIYGKLSDLYGRKAVLVTGVSIFTAGSFLCGMAGEFGDLPILGGGMVQLIVFRAVQGIGGGALFTCAFAIIADMFEPRERGKLGGIFGSVFGLASVLGPILGGFFTDMGTAHLGPLSIAGWRWVFYVNLPLSLLALFMLLVKMPALTHRRPGKIDFLGAGLIIVTFTPLLLALGWAGRDYAWGSPVILGMFALSAVGLAAFVLVERVASNPILDLHLLANRVFLTANSAAFVTSMAFMGTVTFLPLYMQLGQGVPATVSGLSVLPLMLGLIASSTIAGMLTTKFGRYKPFLLAGTLFMCLGSFFLTQIQPTSSTPDILWRMLVLGIGLGPMQSLFSLAVQNAVKPQEIGVATSASQFFRQIGSTIGVAAFGAVLTQNLALSAARAPHAPGAVVHAFTLSDLERMAVASQTAGGHHAAIHAARPLLGMVGRTIVTDSIRGVVFASLLVSAIGLLLTLLVPELPLRSRHPAKGRDSEAESEAALAPAHT